MSTGHPLLARCGTFFLALGFAARLLLPEVDHPVIEATGIGFLVLGSGLLLFEQALARTAPAGLLALLLPLLLVVQAARFSHESVTVKRTIDVWTACMTGFALRGAARGPLRPHLRAGLITAVTALALFGIAQTLWLRSEVIREAHASHHHLTLDERGLAFLGSWRASGTFIGPNAFAGFLLLLGMPVLFLAAASLDRRPTSLDRRVVRQTHTSLQPASARIYRDQVGWVALAAAVLGGFACAGSAGATLAGLAGVLLLLAISAPGRTRTVARLALFLLVAACVAGVLLIALSESPFSGKLRTLQERLDYHRAGFRLLGRHWLFGCGLDRTRLLMAEVTRAGEAFSRYIHDWWLQGFVEGGLAFIPVAILWILTILRGAKAAMTPPASDGPPPPQALASRKVGDPGPASAGSSSSSWWWGGLLAGALLAMLLEPFVSLLPYGGAPPVVLAGFTAAAFAGIGVLVRRMRIDETAFSRGLAAGCFAFALHGFIDFDLYMPGVMVAFAAALALLPGNTDVPTRDASPIEVGLTGFWGVACVLAPVAIVLIAETREHVH